MPDGLCDLPQGWTWVTLGEVCEVVRSQVDPKLSPHDKLNYLSIENVESNSGELVKFKPTMGSEIKSTKIAFSTKDILYSKLRPNLNKVHLPRFDGVSATDLIPLRPLGGLPREYLAYYLRTRYVVEYSTQRMRGIQLPRIPVDDLLNLPVPLGPLNEQRRIVAVIDRSTKILRHARSALNQVPRILGDFRQSVLAKAFRGELTQRDPNDEPAEKLVERNQERRTKKGEYKKPLTPIEDLPKLPEKWCWATVDQLSRVVRGASPRPAGDPRLFGGAIPWITVGSLTADDQPYLRKVSQTLTEAGRERSRYVEEHVLLLTNSGATLGVPKITLISGCINDGVVALLDVDFPTKLYLYYFLMLQTERLRAINQGAAQPNLNTRIIREIPVPLCPLSEQQRIISKLGGLLGRTNQIAATVAQGIRTCDSLYNSILGKAFSGGLVPQDQNDEPASVLLERIRVRRATVAKRGRHGLESVANPGTITPKA